MTNWGLSMLLLTQSVKCVFAKLKLQTKDIVGKTRRRCLCYFSGLCCAIICYLYTHKPFFVHCEALCWSIFWSKLTYLNLCSGQTCFWMTFRAIWRKILNFLLCYFFVETFCLCYFLRFLCLRIKCFLLQE